MSIAMNIDYGVLSRINVPLGQPSDLEVILMSTVRLYHMVTKVPSKDGKGGLEKHSSSHDDCFPTFKKPFPTARRSLFLSSIDFFSKSSWCPAVP